LKEAKDRVDVLELILKIHNEEIQNHNTALRTSAILTRTLGKTFDKVIGIPHANDEITIIKDALDG